MGNRRSIGARPQGRLEAEAKAIRLQLERVEDQLALADRITAIEAQAERIEQKLMLLVAEMTVADAEADR